MVNLRKGGIVDMNTEQQEKFQLEYQLGKQAFERGKYRLSVQHLQNACQFVPLSSQRGGRSTNVVGNSISSYGNVSRVDRSL